MWEPLQRARKCGARPADLHALGVEELVLGLRAGHLTTTDGVCPPLWATVATAAADEVLVVSPCQLRPDEASADLSRLVHGTAPGPGPTTADAWVL